MLRHWMLRRVALTSGGIALGKIYAVEFLLLRQTQGEMSSLLGVCKTESITGKPVPQSCKLSDLKLNP